MSQLCAVVLSVCLALMGVCLPAAGQAWGSERAVTSQETGDQGMTARTVAGEDASQATGQESTASVTSQEAASQQTGQVASSRANSAASIQVLSSDAYVDVTDSSAWYYNSVYRITLEGLMTGYGDGRFGPEDTLTRAQVATILWRYYCPDESAMVCAADQIATTKVEGIASGAWYTAAANWAVSTGVINGVDRGSYRDFDPSGVCTRDQLCTILANVASIFSGAETAGCASSLSKVEDAAAVPDWARDSVGWCLQQGVISGKSDQGKNYAAPAELATRAQMAAILDNSLQTDALGDRPVADAHWVNLDGKWSYMLHGEALCDAWIVVEEIPGGQSGASSQYYFGTDGAMMQDVTFSASIGGRQGLFHALGSGAVAVGVTDDPESGAVYLADETGKLTEATGWLVTGAYSNGEVRRYWVDAETHSCKTGLFMQGEDLYCTLPVTGNILVGAAKMSNGMTYYGDDQGHIALSFSSTVMARGVVSEVVTTFVGGHPVLFFPSNADLSSVTLNFSLMGLGDTVYLSTQRSEGYFAVSSGDTIDLAALGLSADSQGLCWLYCKLSPEASSYQKLAFAVSGNIASVYVISADPDTRGREYVEASPDHSAKANMCFVMVDADGTVLYNADSSDAYSTIKGRGNSTWADGKKKPYQVKLSSKASLITGEKSQKSKTWLLLANYFDDTQLRNYIAFGLGQSIGLTETPECRLVDFYYDGEYRGTYTLCEKVQVGDGRVEIDDLDKENASTDDKSVEDHAIVRGVTVIGGEEFPYQYVVGVEPPADITGGYLIERDERCEGEISWFQTSIGGFTIKSPEYASEEEVVYIQKYIQRIINRGEIADYDLSEFFDMDEMALDFLVQVFSDNPDYYLFSSTYFYKDKDEVSPLLHCGPLWDFDLAFGFYGDTNSFDRDWGHSDKTFFFNNKSFQEAVKRVYQSTFRPAVENLLYGQGSGSYAALRELINPTSRMNRIIWNEKVVCPWTDENVNFDTTEGSFTYLYAWMENSLSWMDKHILADTW